MKFGKIRHILFLGGGKLLCVVLEKAKKLGFSYTIITSERHAREIIGQQTLQEYLEKNGFKFHISQDINKDTFVEKSITKDTLGVSLSAAWIFKEPFIKKFEGRLINLHGSLLPNDRGGGGSTWPILRNAKNIGATIHLVDPGIDTGDILFQWEGELGPKDTPLAHQAKIFSAAENLFEKLFMDIKENADFPLASQDESKSMYRPRVSTISQGFVNWSWTGAQIECFMRAFDKPYPGAMSFVYASGGRIQVKLSSCSLVPDEDFHPFQSGLIYRIDKKGFHIASVGGTLVVQNIETMEGKPAREKISVGDRLYTPVEFLEAAFTSRIIYTPRGLK
ncbi:MAG: formyltransferase family protein [Candidatus Micrarchaeia archaeon]|jgi:methionyl-tRNA formyltransferase